MGFISRHLPINQLFSIVKGISPCNIVRQNGILKHNMLENVKQLFTLRITGIRQGKAYNNKAFLPNNM